MRYAETGYNLEVDLSTGKIEKVETDPKTVEQYLGGQGSALKIIDLIKVVGTYGRKLLAGTFEKFNFLPAAPEVIRPPILRGYI